MSNTSPVLRNTMSPWNSFRDLEHRLNHIFNGTPVDPETDAASYVPAVDLHESDEAYTLVADLPGMKKENIDVRVHDDVVTIKGERKHEDWSQDKGWRRIERSYGAFQRSFRLPDGIDAGNVDAKFEHGVLSVTLPKPEQAKPRQIEVKVN